MSPKKCLSFAASLVMGVAVFVPVFASAFSSPRTLGFQGTLFDNVGNPIGSPTTVSKLMTVRLYNSPTSTAITTALSNYTYSTTTPVTKLPIQR